MTSLGARRIPRERITSAIGLLLTAAFALSPFPLEGSIEDRTFLAADTIEVASNPLEAASLAFANGLASGSRGGFAAFFVPDGIRIQLAGAARAGISSRQAAASVRQFLRDFEEVRAFLNRAATVDGSSERGFAEVLWSGRPAGTSDAVHRTLFLGLVRDGGYWRIDEIRLLR
jgi:hypothetical protein